MHNTEKKHNLIIYNKNPAGYIKNQVATMDSMFENDELTQWLQDENYSVTWADGIFDKLSMNRKFYETDLAQPLKNVRVWQLKPDFDRGCRFVSYDEMARNHGALTMDDYHVVFDGELQTNDLEQIYDICNNAHPEDYAEHSLSMSDMVELYDEDGSSFHYVDRFGFREIDFKEPEQVREPNIGVQKGLQM